MNGGQTRDRETARRTAGFSMAEMLMVVAILGILAGVSFLAATPIVQNMKQLGRDAQAESLYMSSQSRLMELMTYGSAEDRGALKDLAKGSSGYAEIKKGDGGGAATAFIGTSTESLWMDGTIASGNWLIEYYPETMTVVNAWYSDEVAIPASRGGLIGADKADDRKAAKVGWYGGDAPSAGYLVENGNTACDVDIINGEELRARMSVRLPVVKTESGAYPLVDPTSGKLQNNSGATFTIAIRNSGSTSGGWSAVYKLEGTTLASDDTTLAITDVQSEYHGAVKPEDSYLSLTWEMELDSLKAAEKGFAARFNKDGGANDLILGGDIDLTLKVANEKGYTPTVMDYDTDNSLFAYVPDNEDSATAHIACGRHLQNLDVSVSGVTTITDAVQIADVEFGENTSENGLYQQAKSAGKKDAALAIYSWKTTYGESAAFLPIVNEKLKTYSGSDESLGDGGTGVYEIHDLTAKTRTTGSGAVDTAGLFGEFTGKLTDVRLVDPVISVPAADVGGLIGRATGATELTGCAVYYGATSTAKDRGGDTADAGNWITGGTNVGGLVGDAKGALTIKKSFAATVVKGATVGGLVGTSVGALTVEDSYADVYLAGTTVGGLAGGCGTGSSFTSCYSAGFLISDADAAAGFVPAAASVSDSYTVLDFGVTGDEGNTVAVYYDVVKSGTASNVLYAYKTSTAEDAAEIDGIERLEMEDNDATTSESWEGFRNAASGFGTAAENSTVPYHLSAILDADGNAITLEDYPYPTLTALAATDDQHSDHYNDWQEYFATEEDFEIVYLFCKGADDDAMTADDLKDDEFERKYELQKGEAESDPSYVTIPGSDLAGFGGYRMSGWYWFEQDPEKETALKTILEEKKGDLFLEKIKAQADGKNDYYEYTGSDSSASWKLSISSETEKKIGNNRKLYVVLRPAKKYQVLIQYRYFNEGDLAWWENYLTGKTTYEQAAILRAVYEDKSARTISMTDKLDEIEADFYKVSESTWDADLSLFLPEDIKTYRLARMRSLNSDRTALTEVSEETAKDTGGMFAVARLDSSGELVEFDSEKETAPAADDPDKTLLTLSTDTGLKQYIVYKIQQRGDGSYFFKADVTDAYTYVVLYTGDAVQYKIRCHFYNSAAKVAGTDLASLRSKTAFLNALIYSDSNPYSEDAPDKSDYGGAVVYDWNNDAANFIRTGYAGATVDVRRDETLSKLLTFEGFKLETVRNAYLNGKDQVVDVFYVRNSYQLRYDWNKGRYQETLANGSKRTSLVKTLYSGQPISSVLNDFVKATSANMDGAYRSGYSINESGWTTRVTSGGTTKTLTVGLGTDDTDSNLYYMPGRDLTVIADWVIDPRSVIVEIYYQNKTDNVLWNINGEDDKKTYAVVDASDPYTTNISEVKEAIQAATTGEAVESAVLTNLLKTKYVISDEDKGYMFTLAGSKTLAANQNLQADASGRMVVKLYYDRRVLNLIFAQTGYSIYTIQSQYAAAYNLFCDRDSTFASAYAGLKTATSKTAGGTLTRDFRDFGGKTSVTVTRGTDSSSGRREAFTITYRGLYGAEYDGNYQVWPGGGMWKTQSGSNSKSWVYYNSFIIPTNVTVARGSGAVDITFTPDSYGSRYTYQMIREYTPDDAKGEGSYRAGDTKLTWSNATTYSAIPTSPSASAANPDEDSIIIVKTTSYNYLLYVDGEDRSPFMGYELYGHRKRSSGSWKNQTPSSNNYEDDYEWTSSNTILRLTQVSSGSTSSEVGQALYKRSTFKVIYKDIKNTSTTESNPSEGYLYRERIAKLWGKDDTDSDGKKRIQYPDDAEGAIASTRAFQGWFASTDTSSDDNRVTDADGNFYTEGAWWQSMVAQGLVDNGQLIMDAQNLQFFAKWEETDFTVYFYGAGAAQSDVPTRAGIARGDSLANWNGKRAPAEQYDESEDGANPLMPVPTGFVGDWTDEEGTVYHNTVRVSKTVGEQTVQFVYQFDGWGEYPDLDVMELQPGYVPDDGEICHPYTIGTPIFADTYLYPIWKLIDGYATYKLRYLLQDGGVTVKSLLVDTDGNGQPLYARIGEMSFTYPEDITRVSSELANYGEYYPLFSDVTFTVSSIEGENTFDLYYLKGDPWFYDTFDYAEYTDAADSTRKIRVRMKTEAPVETHNLQVQVTPASLDGFSLIEGSPSITLKKNDSYNTAAGEIRPTAKPVYAPILTASRVILRDGMWASAEALPALLSVENELGGFAADVDADGKAYQIRTVLTYTGTATVDGVETTYVLTETRTNGLDVDHPTVAYVLTVNGTEESGATLAGIREKMPAGDYAVEAKITLERQGEAFANPFVIWQSTTAATMTKPASAVYRVTLTDGAASEPKETVCYYHAGDHRFYTAGGKLISTDGLAIAEGSALAQIVASGESGKHAQFYADIGGVSTQVAYVNAAGDKLIFDEVTLTADTTATLSWSTATPLRAPRRAMMRVDISDGRETSLYSDGWSYYTDEDGENLITQLP